MTINRTELEKLLRHLRAAVNILEAELEPIVIPPEVIEEVRRKADSRICLAWDHPIPEGETPRRGLCHTDYNTTFARINRGEESERDLMLKGKLGPPGKRGRPAARDLAEEQEAKRKKVADDLERYEKKKAAKKKGESNE